MYESYLLLTQENNIRILLLDIETSPNTAYVWSLWKENIPLARLIESSEVLCWSAKWVGKNKIMFDSIHKSSPAKMLEKIKYLLNEADAVVHYNGSSFDIPCLNKEFLKHEMFPPAPYKQTDLLQVVRNQFRFPSNKLDYVCNVLGLGQKKETSFKLWIDCMNKDSEAWAVMEEYNKHDVLLLEKLYFRLIPWIKSHANHSLYKEDSFVCPNCGGKHYHRRGFQYTNACKYQRFQCVECGTWFRGTKSLAPKPGLKFVNV